MKKDDIIDMRGVQLKAANEQLKAANAQVSIKSGSARAVMSFMKLYQREEALCLD